MNAAAWVAISVSVTGLIISLLLVVVAYGLKAMRAEHKIGFVEIRMEIKEFRGEVAREFALVHGEINGLSTRVTELKERVQAIEVTLLKPPHELSTPTGP
jgi:hypothetical protein